MDILHLAAPCRNVPVTFTLDLTMPLTLLKSDPRDDNHYFSTDRVVTIQIGRSTNAGMYVWSVFHPDIKCAIWGGESASLALAKEQAGEWVTQWVCERET